MLVFLQGTPQQYIHSFLDELHCFLLNIVFIFNNKSKRPEVDLIRLSPTCGIPKFNTCYNRVPPSTARCGLKTKPNYTNKIVNAVPGTFQAVEFQISARPKALATPGDVFSAGFICEPNHYRKRIKEIIMITMSVIKEPREELEWRGKSLGFFFSHGGEEQEPR